MVSLVSISKTAVGEITISDKGKTQRLMKKREVDVPERTARHRLQMAEELKAYLEIRGRIFLAINYAASTIDLSVWV